MTHYLALLLCCLFCIFVYWIDSKRDSEVSPAVWLPVLWMSLCASRSLNYWFYSGPAYDIVSEGNVYDRVYLSVLTIAGLLVLLQRRSISFAEIFSRNIWLFVFYLYMALSTLWADSTDISFKRWIKTFGDLTMVLVVLTESNPLKAISKLYRRCFILLIPLSIVLIRYFPNLGKLQSKGWQPDMWIGVATHKNTLGQLLLLSWLYFLWDLIKNSSEGNVKIKFFYLIMIAYLINGNGTSRSTTCLVLMLIAFMIYFYLERYKEKPSFLWKPVIYVTLVPLIIFVLDDIVFNKTLFQTIVVSEGKDVTLTGRTHLWDTLIPLGMRHPILGAGFGDFWNVTTRAYLKEIFSWGPGQAHNGYIEIFLNLGMIGLVFFAVVVFSAFRGALKQSLIDFEYGKIRLIFLIVTLIHNYTESGFTRPCHLMWFTFLLFAVNINHVSSFHTVQSHEIVEQAQAPYSSVSQR